MGKEHDLLEAARSGNVAAIEKLIVVKNKKPSGPLSFAFGFSSRLKLLVNVNCYDGNGDSPLHLASLNGHDEAVHLLLIHEASKTAVDQKGCTALHLAAWNGKTHICRLLLTCGQSMPSLVNMQNNEGDTALHCASQYGHSDTVVTLLEFKADPFICNLSGQSALDLAAQYGRLAVVQHLISHTPALLMNQATHKLSPLHLAARSGHRDIVEEVLNSGFDVNFKCEDTTALHQAAMFCKGEVIKLLVERGINLHAKNKDNLTALDLLAKFTSQASLDAISIIKQRMDGSARTDTRETSPHNATPSPQSGSSSPRSSPKHRNVSAVSTLATDPSHSTKYSNSAKNSSTPYVSVHNADIRDFAHSPLETHSTHEETPPTPPPRKPIESEGGVSAPLPMYAQICKNKAEEPLNVAGSPEFHTPPPLPPRNSSMFRSVTTSVVIHHPTAADGQSPSKNAPPSASHQKPKEKPPRKRMPGDQRPFTTMYSSKTNVLAGSPQSGRQTMSFERNATTSPSKQQLPDSLRTDLSRGRDDDDEGSHPELDKNIEKNARKINENRYMSVVTDNATVRMNMAGGDLIGLNVNNNADRRGDVPESQSDYKCDSFSHVDVNDVNAGDVDDITTREESHDVSVRDTKHVRDAGDGVHRACAKCDQDGTGASRGSCSCLTDAANENGSRPPSLVLDQHQHLCRALIDPNITATVLTQLPTPDHPPPSPHTAAQGIMDQIRPHRPHHHHDDTQDKRLSRDIDTMTEVVPLADILETNHIDGSYHEKVQGSMDLEDTSRENQVDQEPTESKMAIKCGSSSANNDREEITNMYLERNDVIKTEKSNEDYDRKKTLEEQASTDTLKDEDIANVRMLEGQSSTDTIKDDDDLVDKEKYGYGDEECYINGIRPTIGHDILGNNSFNEKQLDFMLRDYKNDGVKLSASAANHAEGFEELRENVLNAVPGSRVVDECGEENGIDLKSNSQGSGAFYGESRGPVVKDGAEVTVDDDEVFDSGDPSNVVRIGDDVVVMRRNDSRSSTPDFSGLFCGSKILDSSAIDVGDNSILLRSPRLSGVETSFEQFADQQSASADDMAAVGQKKGEDDEEWSQIAEIMESFGACIARESVFVRDYESDFTKHLASGTERIKTVGDWLASIGMSQYENTLVANGFDDLDFVGAGVLDNADLEQIGITDNQHRDVILGSQKSLPTVSPIDANALPESVDQWLESLRLSEYIHTFDAHGYSDMQRVVQLWELELTTVLDITTLGHRKRILASLGDRSRHVKPESPVAPARAANINIAPLEKLDTSRKPLTSDLPESPRPSPIDGVNFFKDYTKVRPINRTLSEPQPGGQLVTPPVVKPKLVIERSASGQHIQDDAIHIRPPKTSMRSTVKAWRHQPQKLIKGCCNYSAQYLGSTLVKELNGVDSTREGILKMKKSTDSLSKVPTIMLSISYRGVKFIDAKSKRVVCEHDITNIFCACQDQNDLNFFAYITKDHHTSKNYCHTFSVRSTELAQEIILTLGEAFEIAYQIALKDRAEKSAREFDHQLGHNGSVHSTRDIFHLIVYTMTTIPDDMSHDAELWVHNPLSSVIVTNRDTTRGRTGSSK